MAYTIIIEIGKFGQFNYSCLYLFMMFNTHDNCIDKNSTKHTIAEQWTVHKCFHFRSEA